VQALFSSQTELFETGAYDRAMRKKERPPLGQRLAELREATGLTQVQLAGRVGVHPSNIGFWELSGTPPRGEVLPKLAEVLGVSVDVLLGVTPPKPKRQAAKGRLQLVFESAAKLPRRQQEKIVEVVEAMVEKHSNDGNGNGANSKAA
jgi:transcriptional regulator with XRE-family HTH domain